jgi:glycosyltransferase involved in cell wall biosynthesis
MKICFWGNVSGALKGQTEGGGELQIAFIARALASCGHEVVVVDYATKEEFTTPEGIRVYTIRGWNRGVRVLRTLTHRLPGLYATLKEQKADIYYVRIRDFRHLIAYNVSRKVNAGFVIHMAADLDIMSFGSRLKGYYLAKSANLWWFFSGLLIELVYPWLIKNADRVIVQHSGQKDILLKKNIEPIILYNLIDMTKIPSSRGKSRKDFVYVGWLDKRKGFPDFFRIIERSPQHTFKIIGPPRDETGYLYFEQLKNFSNVRLMGELSHSKTLEEISDSKALISTSPMEGFPNVFIEAWACGIPVYSLLVDPGNVIEREGLGVIAHGDPEVIIRALDEHRNTEEFTRRSLKYVERHHAINSEKIAEINRIFSELRNGIISIDEKTILQTVDNRMGQR